MSSQACATLKLYPFARVIWNLFLATAEKGTKSTAAKAGLKQGKLRGILLFPLLSTCNYQSLVVAPSAI